MDVAKTRQKLRENFKDYYEQLCALQNTCPLATITANLQENFIDCNADRIRLADWTPFLNALKCNVTLRFFGLRNFWNQTNSQNEAITQQRAYILRKRIPAVRSKDITSRICKSLKEFLTGSSSIEYLVLEGIPFRDNDLNILAKGISKSKSLKYLSLEFCRIGDNGLMALAGSLKKSTSLNSINLCGCGLTWVGAETICDIIKHQATKRHGEAWQESLRYRRPDLNGMLGLRRINLCKNTLIGDKGIELLADALKDDLWIKAIDLQQCGISSQGAEALLASLDLNRSIRVVDVRLNPLLDRSMIKKILGKVMSTTGGEDPEYPWLTLHDSRETRKTKLPRKPVRFTLNRSSTKLQGLRVKNRSTKVPKGNKLLEQHFRHEIETKNDVKQFPWRTAARLERNKYKSTNPVKSLQTLAAVQTENRRQEVRITQTRRKMRANLPSDMEKLSLEDLDNENVLEDEEVKELRIQLIDYKRRHENAIEERAKAETRIRELEVENRKLRNEISLLKNSGKALSFNGARQDRINLEDENVLENIEASFQQFHKFLDLVKNTNLGQLYQILQEESK